MKLFVRGLLSSGLLFVGLFFAGCSSSPSIDDLLHAGGTTTTNSSHVNVAKFHVGETVSVMFSGIPDTIPPHEEPIKEDGTITLPLIGPVQAAGKTAGELQAQIHDLYVPKYYVRLTVTIKPGDLVYYVKGEVKTPGRQIYVGEITVTKAITSAGDMTDFASHSNVWLIRANGQRIKVNVDDVLENPSQDPQVYPGDQIVVERRYW